MSNDIKPVRIIPIYPAGLRHREKPGEANLRMEQDGMGWINQGIDDWDSDKIIKTLNDLGIDIDKDRFQEIAPQFETIEDLSATWDQYGSYGRKNIDIFTIY